jgi:hypothetical protein
MRKLVIALFALLMSSALKAQIFFVGVESGITQNMIDLRSYDGDALSVPLTLRLGGGLPGLQVFVAYGTGITKPVYVFKDAYTDEERFNEEFAISSFGGGLRLNTSRDNSVGFLMRAGIAQTKIKEKIKTTNGEYEENNDYGKKIGFNFSIGLAVPIGQSLQLAIESEYAMTKLNQWKILSLGVHYVFYSK